LTIFLVLFFPLSVIKRKGRKKTIEETTNFRIGIFTYYRLCRKEYDGIDALKLWLKKMQKIPADRQKTGQTIRSSRSGEGKNIAWYQID